MQLLHAAFAVGAVAGLAHLTGILTSILTDHRYWPPGERDWRFYATWTLSNVLNLAILAVAALDWGSLAVPLAARVAGVVLFVAGYAVAIRGGRDLGFEQTLGLEGDLRADGLYRYSRHPQYVGYVVATVGGMLIPASAWVVPLLAVYLLWWLTLPLAEEPWLVEQFGDDYERYRQRVPRFVGRRSMDPLPAGEDGEQPRSDA